MRLLKRWMVSLFLMGCFTTSEASLIIPIYLPLDSGTGKNVGFVEADDTIYGLLLTPHLRELPPGVHGFHIHQLPSCANKGLAAGSHLRAHPFDQHLGPYQAGHLGDLPVLIVASDGRATLPVLAPRLKISYLMDHALLKGRVRTVFGVAGARIR